MPKLKIVWCFYHPHFFFVTLTVPSQRLIYFYRLEKALIVWRFLFTLNLVHGCSLGAKRDKKLVNHSPFSVVGLQYKRKKPYFGLLKKRWVWMASEGLNSISSTNITEHPNTYLTIFLEFCGWIQALNKELCNRWCVMRKNKTEEGWWESESAVLSGRCQGKHSMVWHLKDEYKFYIRWPHGEEGIPGWLGQYK